MDDEAYLTVWQARAYLESQGRSTFSSRGALIFRYPGEDERRVYPVFINGKGWFYPQSELKARETNDGSTG